jgi:Tfp pilus assembly protein PilV
MHGRVASGRKNGLRRLARRLLRQRGEEGSALIEVLVTAVLGVMLAVGVMTGLDAASATSGTSKARATAADIAQEDQERLRSLDVTELSNRREKTTRTVAGIPYDVRSEGHWVSDKSGTESCTSDDASGDYLKISSIVTWRDMRRVPPVRAESFVAPPRGSFGPDEGSIAVQLRNRDGGADRVQGIGVSLSGRKSISDPTNSIGCTFWGYLPEGNGYEVAFSAAGYVDRQGAQLVRVPASVTGESVTTMPFDYDRAGTVSVSFDTLRNGAAQAAQAEFASLSNSGLDAPFFRVLGSGSSSAAIGATSVFPFAAPYGVYSGDCSSADPRKYGQAVAQVNVQPGGNHKVTVREPALNLRVRSGGSNVAGARVRVRHTGAGCSSPPDFATNSSGRLAEPGLPYGVYDVCAEVGGRSVTVRGVSNTNPAGTSTVNLDVPTTGTKTACS